VGILTTLGGLVLLAVLLTTISDYFAKQVEAVFNGKIWQQSMAKSGIFNGQNHEKMQCISAVFG
jgi:hypothetical protein